MELQIAQDFAEELGQTSCREGLEECLGRASRQMGFDHFAVAIEPASSVAHGSEVLLHDYPAEWASVYVNFDLAGCDPVRRACERSFTGFSWDRIEQLVPLTRKDRQMLSTGRDCGIGDGYTVPRNLPGLAMGSCTFAVGPDSSLPLRLLDAAELVGALALACALRLSGMARSASPPRISDRQRECVVWVARGKTAAETAMILGISPETVVQHLKMARERYEVHCAQTLILSALFDGLIGFSDVFRMAGKA